LSIVRYRSKIAGSRSRILVQAIASVGICREGRGAGNELPDVSLGHEKDYQSQGCHAF
jgi:hypothetical protein